jgi:hypothetical protein
MGVEVVGDDLETLPVAISKAAIRHWVP